jgi:hypothetical protein
MIVDSNLVLQKKMGASARLIFSDLKRVKLGACQGGDIRSEQTKKTMQRDGLTTVK